MHTNQIGSITEAVILAALVRAGKHVLIPFGNYGDYDLLVDQGDGQFEKVQCKTGKIVNGVVQFNAYTQNSLGDRSYGDAVDLYGVYCPQNQKVYLIPAADCNKSKMYLRIDHPKNNHSKHIRWAQKYEVS